MNKQVKRINIQTDLQPRGEYLVVLDTRIAALVIGLIILASLAST